MTPDEVYTEVDDVLGHQDEFVGLIRNSDNPAIRDAAIPLSNTIIIQEIIITFLDTKSGMTMMQKFIIQLYMKDKYDFDLGTNYGKDIKVNRI